MGLRADSRIKFRYEDYKSLPESEIRRYELLDGELVMVPSPSEYHQRLSRNLGFLLWEYVQERDLGQIYSAPLDVVLGQGSGREIVQPDIFFIAKARASMIAETEIRGAPDLIVEILSPATARRDRTYKSTLYARYGVKEYWLVDPESRVIELLTLGPRGFERVACYSERAVLRSPLLPGLRLALTEVF